MKMGIYIMEQCYHLSKMVGGNSNIPMEKDLWEHGLIIKYKEREYTYIRMVVDTKESFSIIKGKDTEYSK